MDASGIILLATGLGIPLATAVTGLVVTLIKDKKKDKIKEELRMDSFYLNTAMNLVRSTESDFLLMTGTQKKAYVMTRLENEIVAAGITVDKFKMSEAIEKAVSLMNTYKTTGKTPEELQAIELLKLSNEKKAEAEEAEKKIDELAASVLNTTTAGLAAAENYLKAKK